MEYQDHGIVASDAGHVISLPVSPQATQMVK